MPVPAANIRSNTRLTRTKRKPLKYQAGVNIFEMLALIAYAAIASAVLKIFIRKYSFMDIFAVAATVVLAGLFAAMLLASLANGLTRFARFVSGKSRSQQTRKGGAQAEPDTVGRE